MIWRVRGTEAFAELRRGSRGSDGPITVVVVPDRPAGGSVEPPRVAFAIGRKVGGAVIRNRVRRRLREALRALDQPGELPAGTYLVIVRPDAAGLGFAALDAHLRDALASARRTSSRAERVPA